MQLAQWVRGQENLEQATEGRGVEFGAQRQKAREPPCTQGKRPCPPGESWGLGSRLRGNWHSQVQVWLRLALVWREENGLGLGGGGKEATHRCHWAGAQDPA